MNIPFLPADILIPNIEDLSKWSVVACDQYTSQPEYWEEVEKQVGQSPSTLNLILPEIYLEKEGVEFTIEKINQNMQKYLEEGIFREIKNSYIYLERTDSTGAVRKGLIGAVDLEEYDYNKGSKSMIRATEGTVLDRLPPRVKVREKAWLELPHIMILIDDIEKNVIEPISENINSMEKIYDFELMQQSGHVKGYVVPEKYFSQINNGLINLKEKSDLLFAVGDGNHSLATAKKCFENIKKLYPKEVWEKHPARYALVEIVNLHDNSIVFEPIHRIVKDIDYNHFIEVFYEKCNVSNSETSGQKLSVVHNKEIKPVWINNTTSNLPVGTLQNFIDEYIKAYGGKVDYIHGDEVVTKLAKENNIGFLLPTMNKTDLFKTVILDGSLPRKTFSMGNAADKRFYLECRKIRV